MAFDASTTAILVAILGATATIISVVWRMNATLRADLRGDIHRLSDRMLAVEKETWRLSGRLEIAGIGRAPVSPDG